MKSKKKNKTNIPTNNDEDTIERRIHNESNTNDDINIGKYNEIDRNGNELEKNNSNQILIEIEKIFEQKIKIINDKIEKEKNLTSIMVTHNLRYAVEYGTRLIMMHQGEAIIDKSGEAKKNMDIKEILNKFTEISIELGN